MLFQNGCSTCGICHVQCDLTYSVNTNQELSYTCTCTCMLYTVIYTLFEIHAGIVYLWHGNPWVLYSKPHSVLVCEGETCCRNDSKINVQACTVDQFPNLVFL